jgi:predicted short-subunit dehydrogenase-like oxidoreductase (DUF2520 family)
MENNIIERLFSSFTDLETAIESAKKTLRTKDHVPGEILARLDSYDGILAKQRGLAASLCECINKGDWDEVNRHVGLINGLSALIRDDARAILSALVPVGKESVEDDSTANFC